MIRRSAGDAFEQQLGEFGTKPEVTFHTRLCPHEFQVVLAIPDDDVPSAKVGDLSLSPAEANAQQHVEALATDSELVVDGQFLQRKGGFGFLVA